MQPGTDEIIDAIGAGFMVGIRRGGSSESFNLGVGLIVDPNVKTLGDGIEPNKPLPVGETDVRFRNRDQRGWMMMASFGF